MADYGTMQARIANELRRSDLTDEIRDAIQGAISHYEEERFWFNEDRSTTFSTVADQEFYTSADAANIPNISEFDTLRITVTSNWNYPLIKRTYQEIDAWQSNANFTAYPTDYCRYDKSIRLYPIPNGAYTIRVSGTLLEATLSASADTNPWMTDGERLIRAHAKWIVFTDQLRDPVQAQAMAGIESRVYAEYLSKTVNRVSSGRVRGTQF
jgi:hypothetical protein